MAYRVLRVTDAGRDRLLVSFLVDGEAEPRTAEGWVSAVTNHFDPEAYGDDGHRDPAAQPRPMTADERAEYVRRLIAEQHPDQGRS